MAEFQAHIFSRQDTDPSNSTIDKFLVDHIPPPEDPAGIQRHIETAQSNLKMLSIIRECHLGANKTQPDGSPPIIDYDIGVDAAKFYLDFVAGIGADLLCSLTFQPDWDTDGWEIANVKMGEHLEAVRAALDLFVLGGRDAESYYPMLIVASDVVIINLDGVMRKLAKTRPISDTRHKDHLFMIVRFLGTFVTFASTKRDSPLFFVKGLAEAIIDVVDSEITSYDEKADALRYLVEISPNGLEDAVLHGGVEKMVNKLRDLRAKIKSEGNELMGKEFSKQVVNVIDLVISKSKSGLDRFLKVEGLLEAYGFR